MMPYGWRMVRAWGVGLALTCVWFGLWLMDLLPNDMFISPKLRGEGINWSWTSPYLAISTHAFLAMPIGVFTQRKETLSLWIKIIAFALLAWGLWQITEMSTGFPLWPTLQLALMFAGPHFLVAALLCFGPGLAVYAKERFSENPAYRRGFVVGKGASSRWAGPASLGRYAKRLFWWFKPPSAGYRIKGVYLGRSIFDDDLVGRDMVIEGDSHMLTIGQTGSGKSVTSIWPNLAMYDGPAIVIDPKGEHRNKFYHHRGGTGGKRISYPLRGGKAFFLDPFGLHSSRYNLLSEIDIKSSKDARKRISAITSACVVPSGGENRFWEETARLMLDGAIAHVLSQYPAENHTLPFVSDLLIGIDPETGFADPDRFKETLIEMRMNNAAGGLPQRAASTLDDLGDRAYGNVVAELQTALKWVSDPAMREQLSDSDFAFADLGRQGAKITVFIVLPFGDLVEQSRWLRSLVQLSMRILESREKKTRPPVLYVLDELPQYGKKLQAIKEGMVTLRSAGVKLWPFVQELKQLEECFGEEGAVNFESSACVQVYGVSDTKTAAWVSEKLGKRIVKDKGGFFRRILGTREVNLVDAASVSTELGKTAPLQYVFPPNGSPLRLERMAFKPLKIEGQDFRGLPLEGHYRADG